MVACDRFDTEIAQINKKVKEVENDEDKCAYYDFLSKIEDLEVLKGKLVQPKIKILEENPTQQFKNHGKYTIETLLWYLWDNADIQVQFIHNYLIPECTDYL